MTKCGTSYRKLFTFHRAVSCTERFKPFSKGLKYISRLRRNVSLVPTISWWTADPRLPIYAHTVHDKTLVIRFLEAWAKGRFWFVLTPGAHVINKFSITIQTWWMFHLLSSKFEWIGFRNDTMMTSSNGNISALLALCDENPPVTGGSPPPKQWKHRWFETPSQSLWCHCNDHSDYNDFHVWQSTVNFERPLLIIYLDTAYFKYF